LGATYDFESGFGVRDGPATGGDGAAKGRDSAGVKGAGVFGEDGVLDVTELDWRRRAEDRVGTGGV
jgi:hypothetical protein